MTITHYQAAYQYRNELLAHLQRWLRLTRLLDKKGPNHGGEDEANYAVSFLPYWLLTQVSEASDHFDELVVDLLNWVETDCYQGYEPVAEAHHGTEPFLFFLPRYSGLFPQNQAAQDALIQAANFIGNWVPGQPQWYDYEHSRFVSIALGSKTVDLNPKKQIEIADQLRFIHIALSAYALSNDQKYLDWALDYGLHWASLINQWPNTQLPQAFYFDGRGVGSNVGDKESDNLLASHHHAQGDPLVGIENLLASGFIHALGDLYRHCPNNNLKVASHKVIEALLDSLLDPYGDPAVDAIRHYRLAFQDRSFDQAILSRIGQIEFVEGELYLTMPERVQRGEPGVGRRADMLHWYVQQGAETLIKFRMPSPIALTLAFDLTGNPVYAKEAFRIAAAKLGIGVRGLRSGREHADMGSAICSIAAGHGRNWMCGAVTGTLFQLSLGGWVQNGFLHPLLTFEQRNLHNRAFSLVQTDIGKSRVHCFNPQLETTSTSWKAGLQQHTVTLAANQLEIVG